MKAISLWQPWASAIALGYKAIETRGWPTRHRGAIAIHAAKRWTRDERDMAKMLAEDHGLDGLLNPPRGCIVAIADLVSVRPTEHLVDQITKRELMLGNYVHGRFGWMLENVRPLKQPVPFRGMQGLFEVPDEVMLGQKKIPEGKKR